MMDKAQKIYDLSPYLDKDLAEALQALPEWSLSTESLPFLRAYEPAEDMTAPDGFTIENHRVSCPGEDHRVPVRVYRPEGLAGNADPFPMCTALPCAEYYEPV